MNSSEFNSLKVGYEVKCLNSEGWGNSFEEGGVYTVTELWLPEGVDLDNEAVSTFFKSDFELHEEES